MRENTKVTSYDFTSRNPFEDITQQILDGARDKVTLPPPVVPVVPSASLLSYFTSLWGSTPDLAQARIAQLRADQHNATNYAEWTAASLELDTLEGNDKWKLLDQSDLYDYKALQAQLDELRVCRESGDYDRILYIIRTTWKRDIFGINNQELYSYSHIGTKRLIEEYIHECDLCLAELASPDCPIDDEVLLDTLTQSKRNYGRTAMTMSGGGAFGLIGIGLFSTLLENDVFPKIVSGSSGGSIVCSIVCSKNSDEVVEILTGLFENKFQVFSLDDDPDTFYTHLSRFLKYGVWFDSKYLQTTMQRYLGDITFKEAYNKTGRILNITVSSASMHDQPTLLNYLTAPNVLVWSAVCASCSLPFIFPSSAIYERNPASGDICKWSNPSLKFVDGSLNSDLPIPRLSEMFNVNHVIACQVNPHITPLVKLAADCLDVSNSGIPWAFKRYAFRLASFATQETIHYMDLLKEFGICENLAKKVKQMLMQSYSGDITILPDIRTNEIDLTLSNPTPSFIWECILKGARGTWPKLSMIKDQLTLEFSMDHHISKIKSRVVFGSKGTYGTSIFPGIRSSSSMYGLSDKHRKNGRPNSIATSEQPKCKKTSRSPAKNTHKHLPYRYKPRKAPESPNDYRSTENESPFGNKYTEQSVPATYSYYDVDEPLEFQPTAVSAKSTQSLIGLVESPRKGKRVAIAGANLRVRSNSTVLDTHPRRSSGGFLGKTRHNSDILASPRSAGSVLTNRRPSFRE